MKEEIKTLILYNLSIFVSLGTAMYFSIGHNLNHGYIGWLIMIVIGGIFMFL